MADVRLERRDSWRTENILRPSFRLTRTQSNIATANRKVCKFFASPNGCAHGENCNFTHDRECRKAARAYTGRQECKSVKKNQVIVSGLPRNAKPEDLFRLFDLEFGRVLDAIIPVDELGIVTFQSSSAALAAVHAGHVHFSGRKVIIRDAHTGESCDGVEPPNRDRLEEEREMKLPQEERQPLLAGDGPLPPWVIKFVEWLPDFLDQVEKRLGEGQCYPLCTLKGDFRATCGMELDHASVGYEKLADFLRTEVPHICKLKVVPVGTGPAMHIVIEKCRPALGNLKLPSAGSADVSAINVPVPTSVTAREAAVPLTTWETARTGDTEAATPLSFSDTFTSLFSYDLFENKKLATSTMEQKDIKRTDTDEMEPADELDLWKDKNEPEFIKELLKDDDCSSKLASALRCDCCWDKLATCVALPCGHFALCESCKQVLHRSEHWTSECAVCHEQVAGWLDL